MLYTQTQNTQLCLIFFNLRKSVTFQVKKKSKGANFSLFFIIYRKTTEISRLLSEKEELQLKNKELMVNNSQLTAEKEELCKDLEEKLSKGAI